MMLRMIRKHPVKLFALTAATLIGVACSDQNSTENTQPEAVVSGTNYDAAQFDATAKPKFTSEGGATPFRTANTIPYWSSSFVDPTNGVTYPYTMVGTNPDNGNVTTTVPSVIIPFKFVFASAPAVARVMDGTDDVAATLASPIFSNYTYPVAYSGPGEVTQYGDAIYRAQWNKVQTGYHVLLGQPTVLPTQTIEVPANQGFSFVGSRGALVGLIDYYWFSPRLKNAVSNLHVPANVIPIILTHNTMLYVGNTANCCIIGYHGADASRNGNGAQQVQTYMFGSYITPRTFGGWPANADAPQGAGLSDIHAISHEVSEWYDDPFVNNFVQPWEDEEFAPQYGCTSILETGDPVVGIWFPLAGNPQAGAFGNYHPEDEVHFSFFARENPSRAYGGHYTYIDFFDHPAHNCS